MLAEYTEGRHLRLNANLKSYRLSRIIRRADGKTDEQQRETTSFEYEYYIKKLIKNDKITACIKKLSVGRG